VAGVIGTMATVTAAMKAAITELSAAPSSFGNYPDMGMQLENRPFVELK